MDTKNIRGTPKNELLIRQPVVSAVATCTLLGLCQAKHQLRGVKYKLCVVTLLSVTFLNKVIIACHAFPMPFAR
ncbi:hypothetical protein [Bordetella ansorpii]|uniref:hypothetical protein n=1 Tax=Bordetella ansorpii TaxID=288768 RepID=UPI0012E8FA6C|nr:hypothetical protein [Bordetella ansorpii]